MAEVEGDGSEVVGAREELGVGERVEPAGGVFGGELEGVEDLAADGVDVGEGAAEPGFGGGGGREFH
jgi:hypothetical protein